MNIRTADSSDRERWDTYVLNHPQALAYHLFAWKEAVKKAYGFDALYLIAERHQKITGILPLIALHLPLMPATLISLPYCDAGGPLADSVEIEKQLLFQALDLSRRSPKIKGRVNIRSTRPFADIEPGLTVNREKARMLLDLPESSELLLDSLKAKVRSQVKKPIRDGLTAQVGGKELLPEFYPLFAENMRDLGSPVHSRKWIQSILEAYRNRAHLVLVRMPDQTPAAGGIILCHSSTVSVPWASALRCFNRWNPNMLLYWNFLKFASDKGYKTFDFGRSTPGEGTFRFKQQWGAKPLFLHWADFDPNSCQKKYGMRLIPLFRSSSQLSSWSGKTRKSGEALFMNLPLSLSKGIAPLFRRHIAL